jgi:perosamine synthetase
MSVGSIVRAIEQVLPERRPLHHHEPSINGKEQAHVADCLKGGIGSDQYIKRLSRALSGFVGVEQAVCVSSGTAALHLALLAVGVQPGDEVLVPTLTFAATANAIKYAGAIPNFVDGKVGINAYKLWSYLEREATKNPNGRGALNKKTGRVISAIVVVDLLGVPADYAKLNEVAGAYGLFMIEDAAQALGSCSGNRKCGSFGDAATFSFNNNKIVTGNGGGAILTNNSWIAAKAYQLATTARTSHPWLVEHDAIGFNYRLPSLNASLALAQFDRLDDFLQAKKRLLTRYKEALVDCDDVEVMDQGGNNWLITLMLKPQHSKIRDEVLNALHERSILARALFTPLHKLKIYEDCPRDNNLMYAEDTFQRAICLPSGVEI